MVMKMPSPFPGMDPYLEHPNLWMSVHEAFVTYAAEQLNAILPQRYVASINGRLYIAQPQRDIYLNMAVMEHPSVRASEGNGHTAMAIAIDAPLKVILEPVETREAFIEIISLMPHERVVTIIEVLSPSNKKASSEGRRLYLEKQREVLASDVHLIEIDLLRYGEHTVAVPKEALLERGVKWDYLVCLHRGGQGAVYEVWLFTVRQRMPRIAVPLAGDDPDVPLDLQAVFNRCYDAGRFANRVDYAGEPFTPLREDDMRWADAILRACGAR